MKSKLMGCGRVLAAALAVCSLGSSTTSAAPRAAAFQGASNLLAYWPFEETSGTTAVDATGNGHDGMYTGGVTSDAVYHSPQPTANNLRSVSLDGTTGSVDVTNTAGLGITGPLTLAAWVRPTSTPDHQMGIIEMFDDPGTGFINGYFLRLGKVGSPATGHYVKINIGNGSVQNEAAEPGVALTVGAWTHVAGTYDGATLRVYRNGSMVGSASSGPPTASTSIVGLGGGTPNVFAGNIDEARIYNRALTTAEIGVLMNGQTPPTGLMAASGSGQITLTWTAATAAASYNIYRAPSAGGPFVLIANTAATSYTDTTVANSTTYWYQVTALSVMESAPAGPVSSTPLPVAPKTTSGAQSNNLGHRCGCHTIVPGPRIAPVALAVSLLALLLGIGRRR